MKFLALAEFKKNNVAYVFFQTIFYIRNLSHRELYSILAFIIIVGSKI